jgi:hypothetical protein
MVRIILFCLVCIVVLCSCQTQKPEIKDWNIDFNASYYLAPDVDGFDIITSYNGDEQFSAEQDSFSIGIDGSLYYMYEVSEDQVFMVRDVDIWFDSTCQIVFYHNGNALFEQVITVPGFPNVSFPIDFDPDLDCSLSWTLNTSSHQQQLFLRAHSLNAAADPQFVNKYIKLDSEARDYTIKHGTIPKLGEYTMKLIEENHYSNDLAETKVSVMVMNFY